MKWMSGICIIALVILFVVVFPASSSSYEVGWMLGVYDPQSSKYVSGAEVHIDGMYYGNTASNGFLYIKSSRLVPGWHDVYARKFQRLEQVKPIPRSDVLRVISWYKISYPWEGEQTYFPDPSGQDNKLFVTLEPERCGWCYGLGCTGTNPEPPELKISYCPKLNDVVKCINLWKEDKVTLEEVVDLINQWSVCDKSSSATKTKQEAKLKEMLQ